MREYILTHKEKEVLLEYQATKKKTTAYRVLATRIKRSKNRLDEDMKLINTYFN
jgi:hypothetical protein